MYFLYSTKITWFPFHKTTKKEEDKDSPLPMPIWICPCSTWGNKHLALAFRLIYCLTELYRTCWVIYNVEALYAYRPKNLGSHLLTPAGWNDKTIMVYCYLPLG